MRAHPSGAIDPVGLVRQYVKRDGDGERLAPADWFQQVVTWPQEPGYDSHTVIRSYRVERPPSIEGSAKIQVRYELIGWVVPGKPHSTFIPWEGTEVFTFVVIRDEQGWRIAEPMIDQHVLAEVVAAGSNLSPEDAALIRELAAAPPRAESD